MLFRRSQVLSPSRQNSWTGLRSAGECLKEKRRMSSAAQYTYNTIQPYDAPSWARGLRCQPTAYVQLAVRPTPIHRWELPGVPSGFQVFVKRDDLTGSTLTGNKVRKLEFLLAEALQQGCDSVITCGSIQSNHARATAVAARQLGLQPHLLLRQPSQDPTVGCHGNLLQDRLAAAKIIMVPPVSYEGKDTRSAMGLKHMMQEYAEKLKSEGSRPYLIPVGGSNPLGAWGYIEAFREMMEQGVLENFDDIIMTVGSGGTVGGMAAANYLTGSKVKIHAVCVCDTASYFYDHIEKYIEAYGLTSDSEEKPLQSRDLVDVIDGYKGLGYAKSTDEELVTNNFCAAYAVLLIRKMEFLLAEALQQDCDCIATCGAVQSNHCRTAAVAARQLGLQTYLVLGQPSQTIDTDAVSCTGNMLQNRLSGTTVLVCSARSPEMEYDEMELLELKVQEYAKKLRAEGKKPYIIPQGASVTGAWGYFEAFNEMTKQGILENFDDMVIVMGGGDNLAALAIANYLTGSKLRVHGVSVYKNVGHFYKHAEKFLQAFGLTEDAEGKPLKAGDLADIIDGYQGPGYRRSSDEELALLTEINTKTGVMVDPGYNVKGVRGLLGEMQNNPGRFAGKRILYIHTGGLFGLYGGTLDQLLKNTPSTNQVYSYVDVVSDSLY